MMTFPNTVLRRTVPFALPIAMVLGLMASGSAIAAPQDDILAGYAVEALVLDSAFTQFSVERGRDLFLAECTSGKEDTPSCTSCHTTDAKKMGQTRAGKAIDPMALSANSERYTDIKKVEKWFGRNCTSVLGRECTPIEKGDFITYMTSL